MVGDVGVVDDMIHIGDEAMFDEALHQLRQRGVDHVTALSAAPAETAARYGVDSIARVGFSSGATFDRAADQERLRRVTATAAGAPGLLAPDDPATAVIAAVRAADGVLVAGGGNLASTWPLHVFERAALGRIAAATGTPLVVTGQTIGPWLTPADATLVTELLSSARLVGLRESASLDLCTRLGVPPALLHRTIDDAAFVGDRAAPGDAGRGDQGGAEGRAYCAVTFSTHLGGMARDEFVAAAAALLDGLADRTGLDIVFVAHFGSLRAGDVRGDTVLHELVRSALHLDPGRSTAITPPDAVAAGRLARDASFVLTSRYHPAVFAAPWGVPTIGIAVDDYTRVKLTGALGSGGQNSVWEIAEFVTRGPAFGDREVEALWNRRGDIRNLGLDRAATARRQSALWWDEIAAALSHHSPLDPAGDPHA